MTPDNTSALTEMHLFHPRERIGVFIDGAHLHGAARALGFEVDYRRLLDLFRAQAWLIRAYYYNGLVEESEYSPVRALIDWLDYNGYTVTTKPAREFTDHTGRRKIKGNMDIELTVDALELAPYLDQAVLFSGEGDLRRLILQLQRRGVRVTVVSTFRTAPPLVADELRRQADRYLDLADLAPSISRPPSRRSEEDAPTRLAVAIAR